MLARKRAASALLAAALLSLGACDGAESTREADDPSGDSEQAPGENVPEVEKTDEAEE